MLRHLIVDCPFGWCNRMRMIHSGMRVARHYGARLTVVFPEGDLRALLDLPGWVETVPSMPDVEGYTRYLCRYGCRPLDFSRHERVFCTGYSRFEDVGFSAFDLAFYAELRPSALVLERASRMAQVMGLPSRYIGMHIRRGDHAWCCRDVPDGMVIDCLCGVLADCPEERIVVSSEDARLCVFLGDLFGAGIIRLTQKDVPWDGHLTVDQAIRDYAELLVLARGDYVIGTGRSSYSQMAVAYNGSASCRFLGSMGARYI